MSTFRPLTALSLATAAFVGGSIAQASDVKGWEGTEWGMTAGQARSVLGAEAQPPIGRWNYGDLRGLLVVSGFPFGDVAHEVGLYFNRDGLQIVHFRKAWDSPEEVASACLSAQDLLQERYGLATTTRAKGDAAWHTWRFPSTTIEVVTAQNSQGGSCAVTYWPTRYEDGS